MTKVTPFLMFNDQLEPAMKLYKATFTDFKAKSVQRAGKKGPVVSAEFTIGKQRFLAFNGGPHFSFSDGVSLFVDCKDQREVDRYWKKILAAGGKEQMCGWIMDPFGLRWQIIPRRLMELMSDDDPVKAQAVVQAMLKMVKIDVKGLEKAYRDAK